MMQIIGGWRTTIRSWENSFDLILGGRRHEENSPIPSGLNDWIDCLELRFVGDILASEDLAGRASTLMIQQHICGDGEVILRHPESSPSGQDSSLPLLLDPNGLKGY